MIILCDTSSILMLLRIEPHMFSDAKFGCITIKEVHDEMYRTQKFKDKYPWRTEYKTHLKITPIKNRHEFDLYAGAIRVINNEGVINKATGRLMSLSYVDRRLVAYALAHKCKLSSGDGDLVMFANQEFTEDFAGSVSPLEIINAWLEKKYIVWDKEKQDILDSWIFLNEHPQPKEAKARFAELTGYCFPAN